MQTQQTTTKQPHDDNNTPQTRPNNAPQTTTTNLLAKYEVGKIF